MGSTKRNRALVSRRARIVQVIETKGSPLGLDENGDLWELRWDSASGDKYWSLIVSNHDEREVLG
jgi:hypothetical protein